MASASTIIGGIFLVVTFIYVMAFLLESPERKVKKNTRKVEKYLDQIEDVIENTNNPELDKFLKNLIKQKKRLIEIEDSTKSTSDINESKVANEAANKAAKEVMTVIQKSLNGLSIAKINGQEPEKLKKIKIITQKALNAEKNIVQAINEQGINIARKETKEVQKSIEVERSRIQAEINERNKNRKISPKVNDAEQDQDYVISAINFLEKRSKLILTEFLVPYASYRDIEKAILADDDSLEYFYEKAKSPTFSWRGNKDHLISLIFKNSLLDKSLTEKIIESLDKLEIFYGTLIKVIKDNKSNLSVIEYSWDKIVLEAYHETGNLINLLTVLESDARHNLPKKNRKKRVN